MSHAQSQRYPEGRAAQPSPGFVAPPAAFRIRRRACTHMLHLVASGLSLPRAGPTLEETGSCRGCQARLHCQAFPSSGRQTPNLCNIDRADSERHRQPSRTNASEPRTQTWLKSRRMVSDLPFGWIIGLIDCWLKNSLKLMNCWYPSGAGSLIGPISPARRS